MEERFKEHLAQRFPYIKGKRMLLAVSGGLDSVVMTYLCRQARLEFGIAHCNFKLRGKESDRDEEFVRKLSKSMNVSFHLKKVDTKGYADREGVSIQMAARDIRYEWFEMCVEKYDYDYILTAHHLDDSLETFLINTIRGTGLEGLAGIPEINKNILRPLLIFSREEIQNYAESRNILWCEDSSNKEDKYLRNKIRHQVIPLFKEENPGLLKNFGNTQKYLQDASDLLKNYTLELFEELVNRENDYWIIDISALLRRPNPRAILYRLLKDFGFSEWNNVYELLEAQSGKQVFSATHRLVKNRGVLILTEKTKENEIVDSIKIRNDNEEVLFPEGKIEFETVDDLKKTEGNHIIFVDRNKLEFPLVLRRWQIGDYFYPFGMKHRKKVSDFLKDEKVSLPEKEKIWMLISGGKIVWVVGYRSDDRFKITKDTSGMLKLEVRN